MHPIRSLQTFVQTLFSSVWRPSWYAYARTLPPSFAWKFFVGLHVLFAIFILVPLTALVVAFDLDAFMEGVGTAASEAYPEDLVITVQDGRISINQELPYRIPMPEDWQELLMMAEEDDVQIPSSLALFARDADMTPASLLTADAFLIVTETQVYAVNPVENEVRTLSIGEDREFMLDSAMVNAGVREIQNAARSQWWLQPVFYVPFLALLLILVVIPVVIIIRLIQLVIYAFFAWIVVAIALRQGKWAYADVLRLSIFSLTPVLVIGFVFMLAGLPILKGILGLLAYLAWTTYVLSRAAPTK